MINTEELKLLSKPLVEYIRNNYDPYTIITVTYDGVKILNDVAGIPFKKEELQKILELHQKWLDDDPNGVYANLHGADLHGADLHGANLRYADLHGANIGYACWPLWCGGLSVHIDDRQAIQLLYHLVSNVMYSRNTSEELKRLLSHPDIVNAANKFHHVEECGEIEVKEKAASEQSR